MADSSNQPSLHTRPTLPLPSHPPPILLVTPPSYLPYSPSPNLPPHPRLLQDEASCSNHIPNLPQPSPPPHPPDHPMTVSRSSHPPLSPRRHPANVSLHPLLPPLPPSPSISPPVLLTRDTLSQPPIIQQVVQSSDQPYSQPRHPFPFLRRWPSLPLSLSLPASPRLTASSGPSPPPPAVAGSSTLPRSLPVHPVHLPLHFLLRRGPIFPLSLTPPSAAATVTATDTVLNVLAIEMGVETILEL